RIQQAFSQLHADASTSHIIQHEGAEPHTAEEATSILQRELALNGLEEILLLAVREHIPGYRRSLDERVQHVLHLIQQDITAQHSLETLAEAISLSSSRLGHLFKQEVGDSITNVLLSMRLAPA